MTTSVKACPAVPSLYIHRRNPSLKLMKISLSVTLPSMVQPLVHPTSTVWPVNVSPYVTAVLLPLWKALATIGCEYMTGGEVLVLGKIGRNFGAGMSGGYAYILDCDERYVNTGLVELRTANNDDLKRIKELVEQHVLHTNSAKGRHILENWNNFVNRFTKVVPVAYEEMQAAIERFKEQGLSLEEAQLAAFKEKYA